MELSNEFNLKEIEQTTKNYLSKVDLKKLIDDSPDKMDKIMFIEGPPTLNGEPHAGHLRGRVFKDLWYRFNTLNGKNVVFNAGWDTQGLPVELQAEKELGITNGKSEITTQEQVENLESTFITQLNQECDKVIINGCPNHHLPGVISASFPGNRSDILLAKLERENMEVSSGSAC